MQEFFQFAGNYWWLVFPLAAVAGGAIKRLDTLATRRHERKLEMIRAKGELKAAQIAARTNPVAIASEPQPITKPAPMPDQLEKLFRTHDAVTARWLEYELDVAKLIDYPTMSDGRQPLTAAFLKAKKVADAARPASATAKVTADQVAEYRTAVTDYEVAFDLAERDARRQRTSGLSDAERKRLATAKQLLAVATDDSASPAERHTAYRRARAELDGLISLSDEAIVVLEKKVALELPTGTPESPSDTPPQTPRADA